MEIDKIIKALKGAVKLNDLKVSDDTILEQAVDLYISKKIREQYSSHNTTTNNSPELIKPTLRQLDYLLRNNIDCNTETISKDQASKLISEHKSKWQN